MRLRVAVAAALLVLVACPAAAAQGPQDPWSGLGLPAPQEGPAQGLAPEPADGMVMPRQPTVPDVSALVPESVRESVPGDCVYLFDASVAVHTCPTDLVKGDASPDAAAAGNASALNGTAKGPTAPPAGAEQPSPAQAAALPEGDEPSVAALSPAPAAPGPVALPPPPAQPAADHVAPFAPRSFAAVLAAAAGLAALVAVPLFKALVAALGLGARRVPQPGQRDEVLRLVRDRPGLHHRALVQALGRGNGTVEHHVRALVRAGLVVSVKSGGRRRYFPAGTAGPEVLAAAGFAHGMAAEVLRAVAPQGQPLSAVARQVRRSLSTTHYHVSRLQRAGLVQVARQGRVRLVRPTLLAERCRAWLGVRAGAPAPA